MRLVRGEGRWWQMGRTITLPDAVYARLEQQAAIRGIDVAALIEVLEHDATAARLQAALAELRAEGLLLPHRTPSLAAPVGFQPVPVIGKPVSETIIEERR